jgi:hypothetical protein
VSEDPSFLTIGINRKNDEPQLSNPQNMNSYSYVTNNPLTMRDPDGRCPWCVPLVIAGGVGAIGGMGSQAFNDYLSGDFGTRSIGDTLNTYAVAAGKGRIGDCHGGFGSTSNSDSHYGYSGGNRRDTDGRYDYDWELPSWATGRFNGTCYRIRCSCFDSRDFAHVTQGARSNAKSKHQVLLHWCAYPATMGRRILVEQYADTQTTRNGSIIRVSGLSELLIKH